MEDSEEEEKEESVGAKQQQLSGKKKKVQKLIIAPAFHPLQHPLPPEFRLRILSLSSLISPRCHFLMTFCKSNILATVLIIAIS